MNVYETLQDHIERIERGPAPVGDAVRMVREFLGGLDKECGREAPGRGPRGPGQLYDFCPHSHPQRLGLGCRVTK